MRYSKNKDVDKIVKNAILRGCVYASNKKHIKLLVPDNTVLIISSTPKNIQSLGHVERVLKRAGI